MESFNCTEADVNSLMAEVKVFQTMLDTANRIRNTVYMQWILDHIPCEGDGIMARNYIADPATGFSNLNDEDIDLSVLRC